MDLLGDETGRVVDLGDDLRQELGRIQLDGFGVVIEGLLHVAKVPVVVGQVVPGGPVAGLPSHDLREQPLCLVKVGPLADALRSSGLDVVVDVGVVRRCGGVDPLVGVVAAADHSLMVVRPCYLVLRAGVAAEQRPDGVIVIERRDRVVVN